MMYFCQLLMKKGYFKMRFLYIVILVSTMDIFAYLGGKLFGKTKIIPKISCPLLNIFCIFSIVKLQKIATNEKQN